MTSSLLRSMLRMGQKPTVAVQASASPNIGASKVMVLIARLGTSLNAYTKKLALVGFTAGTALLVNGCGGGGVGASTAPIVGGNILVLPAVAELYEGQPVTFTVSGGRPPYQVVSGNPTVLPIPAGTSGNTFTVVSKFVSADTPVTLTVRDADNATTNVTANLRPFVLVNELELTPQVTSPGASCGSAVCSGGDAIVRARAGAAGASPNNRGMRFEVITGDFDFVTPGTSALSSSLLTTSDAQGNALARLKARVNAPNQSALLQVVDVATGNVRKFAFSISQVTDGVGSITVNPTTFAWTAFYKGECVVGGVTNHYIYGGTPPYTVRSGTPDFATFAPSVVTTNGGAVTVSTTGFVCSSTGSNFIVTDATGRTVNFTVANNIGTNDRPVLPAPPLGAPFVTPASFGPLACGISAGAIVTQPGGVSATFTVASTEPSRVTAVLASGVLTITRVPNSPGGADSVVVLVTNGTQTTAVPVLLSPNNCSTAGANPILLTTAGSTTSTNSISVAVGESAPVRVSGGRTPYGIISASPNIVQVSANGQTFATTTAQILVTGDFVVRGVVPGVTFVTVLDSTNPQQSTVLAVTVTGSVTPAGTALTSTPANIAITGLATASGSVTGGTPPYLISSAGPTIAQVSLDGVNFATSTAGQFSQTGQFIVRSVTNGTTFVTVTDSSSPPRSASVPVAVTGVGAVSNPIVATPLALALTGTSSAPVQITGGTGPFTVSSVGPSIAQVSADGVSFQATSVGVASNGAFVVRGVTNGTTFINVVDSSNPSKQTTIPVTVAGAGTVGTPIVAAPATVALTGTSSSAVALSGGAAPYSVVSVGPTLAQVSADGVIFANSSAPISVNSLFVVRGVANGTSFLTVTDSSVPPRSAAIPVTITGATSGTTTPIAFSGTGGVFTTLGIGGGSTTPVFITGGTGPNYTVESLSPAIAQVSIDGNVFVSTLATPLVNVAGQFVLRGVSTGTTFVRVRDGEAPVPRSAILAVTVTSTGAVVTPVALSTSNATSVAQFATAAITITGGRPPYRVLSTAPNTTTISATGNPGSFVAGPISVGATPPLNQFVVYGVLPGTAFVVVEDSSSPVVTTVLVVTVTGTAAFRTFTPTPNVLLFNITPPTAPIVVNLAGAAADGIAPFVITGIPSGLTITEGASTTTITSGTYTAASTNITIGRGAAATGVFNLAITDSSPPTPAIPGPPAVPAFTTPRSGTIFVTIAP